MKRIRSTAILVGFFIILSYLGAHCKVIAQPPSGEGSAFLLAIPSLPGGVTYEDPLLTLHSYSGQEGPASVRIQGADGQELRTFTLLPGQVITVALPFNLLLTDKNEDVRGESIRIVSSVAIWGVLSYRYYHEFEMTSLLPSVSSDTDFFVLSYLNDEKVSKKWINSASKFRIGSLADSNDISIELTSLTDQGTPATLVHLKLQSGQTYQMEGDGSIPGDFTGSKIRATKPLVVFSCHPHSGIPVGEGVIGNCIRGAPIHEQTPSVRSYGKQFFARSYPRRTYYDQHIDYEPDLLRVVASVGGTEVRLNGTPLPFMLEAGGFFDTLFQGAMEVATSAPSIALLYEHSPYNICGGDSIGYASMSILTPFEHAQNYSFFYSPDTLGFFNYVTLVTLASTVPHLRLDGKRIAQSLFESVGSDALGREVVLAQVPVDGGAHFVKANVPADEGFVAQAFGMGSFEQLAYGYSYRVLGATRPVQQASVSQASLASQSQIVFNTLILNTLERSSESVSIYDLLGRRVLEQAIPLGVSSVAVNLAALPSGSYYYRLGSVVKPFMLQR